MPKNFKNVLFCSKKICRLDNMEQWKSEQHAFTIKSFYKKKKK